MADLNYNLTHEPIRIEGSLPNASRYTDTVSLGVIEQAVLKVNIDLGADRTSSAFDNFQSDDANANSYVTAGHLAQIDRAALLYSSYLAQAYQVPEDQDARQLLDGEFTRYRSGYKDRARSRELLHQYQLIKNALIEGDLDRRFFKKAIPTASMVRVARPREEIGPATFPLHQRRLRRRTEDGIIDPRFD